MHTLDCETLDTTYDSLAAILQRPRADLEAWIRSLDPDALKGGEAAVWSAFCASQSVSNNCAWTTTTFFHVTRALDPTAFQRTGLLPLRAPLLDLLWGQLRSLVVS